MARTRQLKIEERLTKRTPNINRYFNELNLEDTLTAEEEFEVATKAAAGDTSAMEKLVKANLRFVVSVAKQYAPTAEVLAELIAQGNMGLAEAATKFDPTRGFKFISFAVWYIRKDILQYFQNFSKTVRVPTNVALLKNRTSIVVGDLTARLDRTPDEYEIIEELQKRDWFTSYDSYKRMKDTGASFSVPLEKEGVDDGIKAPIEYLGSDLSDDRTRKDDVRFITKALFSTLSGEKEKFILTKLYGLDGTPAWTYNDLGDHYNQSRETIRNIEKKVLRHMKFRLTSSRFSDGTKLKEEIDAVYS